MQLIEASSRRSRRRDERGYVLVWFVVSLTVLVLCAAFSIDLGTWYLERDRAQKAADAAALAGVVFMPDCNEARSAADRTLRANGYSAGLVAADQPPCPTANGGFAVRVRKSVNNTFLAAAGGAFNQTIARTGTAEYRAPIALGSPSNIFGNEPLAAGETSWRVAGESDPQLFANINGPLSNLGDADPYQGAAPGTAAFGSRGPTTPAYRDAGYVYTLDVKDDGLGPKTIAVEVFDPIFTRQTDQRGEQACSSIYMQVYPSLLADPRYVRGPTSPFCSGDETLNGSVPCTDCSGTGPSTPPIAGGQSYEPRRPFTIDPESAIVRSTPRADLVATTSSWALGGLQYNLFPRTYFAVFDGTANPSSLNASTPIQSCNPVSAQPPRGGYITWDPDPGASGFTATSNPTQLAKAWQYADYYQSNDVEHAATGSKNWGPIAIKNPYNILTQNAQWNQYNVAYATEREKNQQLTLAAYRRFVRLCTISNVTSGRYYISVRTNDLSNSTAGATGTGIIGGGANHYTLRAVAQRGGTNLPALVNLAAFQSLSMVAQVQNNGNLFLTRINPTSDARRLSLTLFDPGDNSPAGGQVQFVDDFGQSFSGCLNAETGTALTQCRVDLPSGTTGSFDGQALKVTIPIPAQPTSPGGAGYKCNTSLPGPQQCWVRAKFTWNNLPVGQFVRDATSWEATIDGDPVRLVQN